MSLRSNREEVMDILSSIIGLAEILEEDTDRRGHADIKPFLNDGQVGSIAIAIKNQAIQGYTLAEHVTDDLDQGGRP